MAPTELHRRIAERAAPILVALIATLAKAFMVADEDVMDALIGWLSGVRQRAEERKRVLSAKWS